MSLSVGLPGGAAGGRSTAIARGEILVDITNSRSAVINSAREMGQQIQRNLGQGTQQGVRQAEGSLRGLNNTLATTARAFASAFALRQMVSITQNINRVDALFKVLVGSEEAAADEMERLRDLAERANIPFRELVSSSTALLPALRGTNADLSKTLLLAGRLAELDPVQGQAGAAFAIRELLSGTITSLASRFEIPRQALRDLLAEADGDTAKIIEGLSELVDELGLTEDAYINIRRESRNVFAETQSEIQELIALGFTPLLQDGINPVISGFNDLLALVRESNPELAQMAVTMGAIAAASRTAQFAGIRGAGTAGVLAAVGFAGVQAGVAGSRFAAEQGIVDNPELENISQAEGVALLWERIKQSLVILVDLFLRFGEFMGQATTGAASTLIDLSGIFRIGITIFENAWERARLSIAVGVAGIEVGFLAAKNAAFDFRDGLLQNLFDLRTGLSAFLVSLGASLPDRLGDPLEAAGLALVPRLDADTEQRRGADARARDQAVDDAIQGFADLNARLQDASLLPTEDQAAQIAADTDALRQTLLAPMAEFVAGLTGVREDLVLEFASLMFDLEEPLDDLAESSAAAAAAVAGFSDEQIAAFAEFQDDLSEITDKAHAKRLEAEAQHQDAVDDLTADRNRQRKRDQAAEDRRRTAAEGKLSDDIAEAHQRGSARVAEVVTKGKEKELEAETRHQRRRIDRLRQLGRDLRSAAGRVDARAVFHLLQRNREQAQDERIVRDRERSDRRDTQKQRIDEIRNEAAERETALRDSFRKSEAERAEQRRIQREIENEDFQLRLQDAEEAHEKRIAQIDRQEHEQLAAREQAFIEQNNAMLAEQGGHNERMIAVQGQGLDALEQGYANWLFRMQRQTGQILGAIQIGQNLAAPIQGVRIPSFQSGGRHTQTGLFFGHENEETLNVSASQLLRSAMPGGEISPTGIGQLIAAAGANNSRSIGDVHNTFNDVGRMTPSQLENVVRRAMMQVFDELSR